MGLNRTQGIFLHVCVKSQLSIFMNEQIASRLREERKRMGFSSQGDLAERIGVALGSVHNYEAGKRSPDADYLATLAGLGADVLFILTGQRTVGHLAPDEAALLDNYRNTTSDNKAVLRKIGAALEKQVDEGDEQCA